MKLVILIISSLLILCLLLYFIHYKLTHKKVNWVFIIELTSNSTAECRLCQLLKIYPDGKIKVRVTRDNSVRYAKLIGSNYYFLDQYDEALKYVDSVRSDKLEELKSHDI